MLPPLEGKKLVHGAERRGVRGDDPDLSATRKRMEPIADVAAPIAHDAGTGDLTRVHEAGNVEVPAGERLRDRLQVGPDLGHARRVGGVALELDPAAVGESLELVGRGVLVHAHGGLAPRLHRRERRVRLGPPRVLRGEGHSFSDVAAKVVSIINLASVAQLENAVGAPVDPLRFRGNLYIQGWPAWREFELLDQIVTIGAVRLKVIKRIVRCAATNVEPRTGVRDMQIPKTLMQAFGHTDCGVYAQVIAGGAIATGDAITEASPKLF